MSSIQFGFSLPAGAAVPDQRSAFNEGIRRYLTAARQGGLHSAWVTDHFQWDNRDTLECWTTLTYLAAGWQELHFGTAVLGQNYRNPALTAKMAATFQYLTGGRLLFGLGAGWKDDEYRAYGYDFPSPGVRVEQLEEAIQIIKTLWTESQATFHGKHYRVDQAWCAPKPTPIPPLIIGGTGERKMLPLVARYADWWNTSWLGDPAVYAHKRDVLYRACEAIGRDPTTIRLTWFGPCGLARTDQDALALGIRDDQGFVGSPSRVVDRLRRFIDLGVDYFILGLRGFPNIEPMELLVQEVMPELEG